MTRDRGGDVDLTAMPPALVARLRGAWASLPAGDEAAIHGDLHAGNLIWANTGPALIDWDEARRDLPAFDLMGGGPADPPPDPVLARAHLAWEVAVCWAREPARARHLATRL